MAKDRLSTLYDSLQETSPQYAILASSLSNGIEALESFLQSLPGKIETQVCSENPIEGLALRFSRDGKGWQLDVGFPTGREYDGEPEYNWSTLRETTIETKIEATTLFEKLLERMLDTQKTRLEKLSKVQPLISSLRNSKNDDEEGGNDSIPF